jgi:hypothetical protein
LCSSVAAFFGSDFEVMNGHGIEKKEVNNEWESQNYSAGEKEPNSVVKWNCEVFFATSMVDK